MAVSTWEWWEGGVSDGDGKPLDDLEFLRLVILDFVDTRGIPYPVCLPPPLPIRFLVQPYFYPTPSLQTGGVFVVVLLLSLPSVPPGPGNPSVRTNVSRPLCRAPPLSDVIITSRHRSAHIPGKVALVLGAADSRRGPVQMFLTNNF